LETKSHQCLSRRGEIRSGGIVGERRGKLETERKRGAKDLVARKKSAGFVTGSTANWVGTGNTEVETREKYPHQKRPRLEGEIKIKGQPLECRATQNQIDARRTGGSKKNQKVSARQTSPVPHWKSKIR